MYPVVPNFDMCVEWKNITQCSLPQYDPCALNGCDNDTFTYLLEPIGLQCNMNCSKVQVGVCV